MFLKKVIKVLSRNDIKRLATDYCLEIPYNLFPEAIQHQSEIKTKISLIQKFTEILRFKIAICITRFFLVNSLFINLKYFKKKEAS